MNDSEFNSWTEFLLNSYLSGTASEDEIKELLQLSKSSEDLRKRIKDYERILGQIEDLDLMKKVNTSSAFHKIKTRLVKYKNKKDWFFYWQRAAAILLLPLLLVSIFQFYIGKNNELLQKTARTTYNEISTSPGLRSTFILPDGTKVWLNGDTQIKYPLFFSTNERRIQLSGEAYFEVAKNKEKPFIVELGAISIQAVGTTFNCMAYPSDNLIETALTEGKVKITKITNSKGTGQYTLKPGQVISYKLNSDKFYLSEGNLDKHLSWRFGKFMFKNDPLEVVCQKLGRWFNADIVIKDESLKSYAFTGTFSEENLNEILELISLTSPINYSMVRSNPDKNNEYGTLKVTIMKK